MATSNIKREVLDTSRKALFINLDESIYGSFAEIGAGQEVARWFFQSGGASGTVARTISAYDMQFSDSLYGKCPDSRYVSERRLMQMLDEEFQSLENILVGKRNDKTRFFAFANTVTTTNYNKTNEPHGWIGVRFQLRPNSKPNDVVVHVRLLENDALLQQKTLGILGVNLVYACYYNYLYPNSFLQSLLESISAERIEIDMIRMSGPGLDYVDNRLLAVQLVKNGMTNATIFDRRGRVLQPSDLLYKKNVMVLRGSFRPITRAGYDMLKKGALLFKEEVGFTKENVAVMCEITLNNLMGGGEFDERDFMERVDILCGMGLNVMISNFQQFYRLSEWFRRFKLKSIRMIIGAYTFQKILEKDYYIDLKGGVLEGAGLLFMNNLKLYIYPSINDKNGQVVTTKNMPLPEKELEHLYKYLLESRCLIDVPNFQEKYLTIYSYMVLDKMKAGDPIWEEMVPKYVAAFIKNKGLFGYHQQT